MHWEIVFGSFGAAATAAHLLNAWLTNGVRMEISNLRLEIADKRSEDKAWMEEKFVTRTEFEQRFKLLDTKTGIKWT